MRFTVISKRTNTNFNIGHDKKVDREEVFSEEACSAFVTCIVSWLRAQGHPTNVFYEISVPKSKNYLEFSTA